jgi:plasmid stabilization system protein ParE
LHLGYIAEDSIDAADRWIAKLLRRLQRFGDSPGIGHKRDELTFLPVLFGPSARI